MFFFHVFSTLKGHIGRTARRVSPASHTVSSRDHSCQVPDHTLGDGSDGRGDADSDESGGIEGWIKINRRRNQDESAKIRFGSDGSRIKRWQPCLLFARCWNPTLNSSFLPIKEHKITKTSTRPMMSPEKKKKQLLISPSISTPSLVPSPQKSTMLGDVRPTNGPTKLLLTRCCEVCPLPNCTAKEGPQISCQCQHICAGQGCKICQRMVLDMSTASNLTHLFVPRSGSVPASVSLQVLIVYLS